jgi:hypothetical protein
MTAAFPLAKQPSRLPLYLGRIDKRRIGLILRVHLTAGPFFPRTHIA